MYFFLFVQYLTQASETKFNSEAREGTGETDGKSSELPNRSDC